MNNVLLISIDSLGVNWLNTYGRLVSEDVPTPNIDRFASRSVQFERHWAGSLPCMPARREWATGTTEFLWRPWGQTEPFDRSVALLTGEAGVRTALVTDHFHYFEYGGAGYIEDFQHWEFIRGHEMDPWRIAPVQPEPWLLRQTLADQPEDVRGWGARRWRYARNVAGMRHESEFFAPRVFSAASDAISQLSAHAEPWFLYVDSFDIHEPFHNPEPFASMFTDEDPRDPELIIWPYYGRAETLTPRQLMFLRAQYAGKLAMVDKHFGSVLDSMDRLGLWSTTTVIVTSDHGHYLGEHGLIGKPGAPVYDTLARTPLWIAHPESTGPTRVEALTTAVDLQATVLDCFGLVGSSGPHTRTLLPLVRGENGTHRDHILFGYWNSGVNITDGAHTLLLSPVGGTAACYSANVLNTWAGFERPTPVAAAPAHLPYAEHPVWRYEETIPEDDNADWRTELLGHHALFDVEADPAQLNDLSADRERVEGMQRLLRSALEQLGAPPEQFARLGLTPA